MNPKITVALACLLTTIHVSAQTLVKKVKPSDTDPLITTFDTDSNYVYLNTSVSAQNILLVHLPGSYGEPKRATLFGTLASDLGFHSIGLMYPNIPTVGSICTNVSDPSCYENVRREIIEGVDYSADITINASECILNRTKKLLLYLHSNYPAENWGQYLDANNELVFSKIIFSGHSQGGGHAALIGKYFPAKRIICFSSPKDYINYYNTPPLWLSTGAWQTPKSQIYSFNHTLDNYAQQLEILDSMGLDDYGAPVNIDNNSSPYSYTHQLSTSYAVPSGDEHASTVQDNKTPKISGTPVFITVWTYLLTENLPTGVSDPFYEDNATLNFSPNPTNDFAAIELMEGNYTVKVFDQKGKCVLLQTPSTGKFQVDLTGLQAGIYFIQATGDKKIVSGKVVKE